MTTQDYTTRTATDLSDTDARFADLISGIDWLGDDGASLARLGLHQLLADIRTYAYRGEPGEIDVSVTATSTGVTVILEESGIPTLSAVDGPPILAQAFDEVTHERVLGRNRWILRKFRQPAHALG